jgi:hypothetical protein
LNYDEFKVLVGDLVHREDITSHDLLAVPTLRRECGSRLSRDQLDAFLVRLHGEGAIHLLSHVEFETLSEPLRRDALHLASGPALYWIRWL